MMSIYCRGPSKGQTDLLSIYCRSPSKRHTDLTVHIIIVKVLQKAIETLLTFLGSLALKLHPVGRNLVFVV